MMTSDFFFFFFYSSMTSTLLAEEQKNRHVCFRVGGTIDDMWAGVKPQQHHFGSSFFAYLLRDRHAHYDKLKDRSY